MLPTKRKYEEPERSAEREQGAKVWSLGILNEHGQYNDRIQVPSQTSLLELVTLLCNGPVKERRGQHDHDIDAHLWDLKVIPAKASPEKKLQICSPAGGMYSSDGDDADTTVDPSHLVNNLQSLELGGTLCFKYDYGSPTIVMLKVLSISYPGPEQGEQKLEFQCPVKTTEIVKTTKEDEEMVDDDECQKKTDQIDIAQVSAYAFDVSKQIDAFYPKLSKFMVDTDDNVVVKAINLGLSKRVYHKNDTMFCCMERWGIDEALSAQLPWDSMDDFLEVAEEVWTKKVSSHTKSMRCIYPPTSDGEEMYKEEKERDDARSDFAKSMNAEMVFLYKSKDELDKKASENQGGVFNFATAFPRTAGQLTSGKFRWFRYETDGLLKVAVGRGSCHEHTGIVSIKEEQVLRTWKRKFNSFHELLCAVEASWVHPDTSTHPSGSSSVPVYLSNDTFLPEYDADLSPSSPRPPEPPIFSKKDDAVVISEAKGSAPVTFLALAPEANRSSPSLYSGHKNGEVCKWNLETNKQIWKKQVFRNSHCLLEEQAFDVHGLIGIRGIMVQESSSGEHLVYVWSHNYDSEDCDQPNEIKVLNGNHGDQHHTLICEVDSDMAVHPIISCVVYSKLIYDDVWLDCIIVGLKATCACLPYNEKYTDYNIEEAEDFAYGNILPFVGEDVEETWRGGHRGTIRSMAVTSDGYVLSCSEHPGHHFAEALILWSAKSPGVPLHRIDLYKGGPNLTEDLFPPLRTLQGGIAVHGNKILIGGQYGDMIVPIDIDGIDGKEDTQPSLVIKGYGKLGLRYHTDDSFKGCLVGSGNAAITSNEGCEELYIFPLDSLGDNPDIVTDMRRRKFEEWDEHVDEFDETILRARSMALGQIKFRFQKEASASSKKEYSSNNGGPVAVAMKGRYVVAGFDSGSILKAKLLPEEFEDGTKGSSNLYASSFLQDDTCDSPHFDELDHPPEIPEQCIIQ